jgi:CHAD domain-containing protein
MDATAGRPDRDRGEVAIEISAAEQLTRRFRKIRKRGKARARLDARRRHRLRIQAKKVRYAAEFFANLFPGKKAARRRKRFLSALEGVQDGLGDLNDIAVHEDLSEQLVDNKHVGGKRRRGGAKRAFAAGRLAGREEARIAPVLNEAEQAYATFSKAKLFWA